MIEKNARAGRKVAVNSGFFEGRVGSISSNQGDQQKQTSGIWVDIKATDNGTTRRLWWPLGELDYVVTRKKTA